MTRLRLFGLLALATGITMAGLPATAFAALDPTTTAVVCSPASVPTGSPTTCTVTVTDTAATPVGAPSGAVAFTPAPTTGTLSGSASCMLPSGGMGASGSCQVTFTPSAGGDYSINASYAGDGTHAGSSASGAATAVDPTTTTLSCSPSTVQIGTSAQCTATLTDATAIQAPLGTLNFSSSPSGTFGAPGVCQWQPSSTGTGGSATCGVTFTPTVAGGYTLTADYSGDSTHAKSAGTFGVTATTTPAGGGPGSHGGGGGTVTIVVSAGPPPPGKVTIGPSAKVSRRHVGAVQLSCAGASGSSCVGALTLTRRAKVKVRVQVKSKHRSKKGKKGRKTKTKIETQSKTIVVGSLTYTLATRRSQAFTFKLSPGAVKLLAKSRSGRLTVQVWSAGSVVKTITLQGPKHKKHKKHHKHKRHKK